MTFREPLSYYESFILKFLQYNNYGHGLLQGVPGSVGTVNPKIEAFLSTKETFYWEIEVLNIIRDESNNVIDITINKKPVQIRGLGVPNAGGTGDEELIIVEFIESKVFHNLDANIYYEFREYWNDETLSVQSDSELLRQVEIPVDNLNLPVSESWISAPLGQLLDCAVFVR